MKIYVSLMDLVGLGILAIAIVVVLALVIMANIKNKKRR